MKRGENEKKERKMKRISRHARPIRETGMDGTKSMLCLTSTLNTRDNRVTNKKGEI
jgi:hypothetical protein